MAPKLIAATLTAVVLAGCGGTDIVLDPGVGAGGKYPVAADEICAEVADSFAEAQTDTPRSFEQAAELLAVLTELAREGEEALAEIEPSGTEAEAYRRYLDARAEVVAELDRALAAAEDEDGQAFADARESVEDGAGERARLARAAGLRGCAAGERR